MSLRRKEIFEFGEFRLDVSEHTIERIDGVKNGTLPEKAFQALVILVRRRGHLVSRDELIRFIWPDTIVEDNNLEKCIHYLRHFLGEGPDKSGYIETVRKHGYRFIGNVRAIEVSGSWIPETFRFSDVQKESAPAFEVSQLMEPQEVDETEPHLLAPAHAPEPVPEFERLAETSSKLAKTTRYPLWGPVFRSTYILVLLVGLAGLGFNIFIGSDASTAKSGADKEEFHAKGETNNNEARGLYLLAMNMSEERGAPNVLKSLEHLDKALALDPNYAQAWAAKAIVHSDLVGHGDSDHRRNYLSSMEAIEKALAIEPDLAEAYSARCQNKNRYEYDASGAEPDCKRALELNPNSPVAHKTYANFLYTQGRFDEALIQIKWAMDLQPVSYRNQQMFGLTLYFARRYPEAEDQFKKMLQLNTNQNYINERLIVIMQEQRKYSEAFEYLSRVLISENASAERMERFKTAFRMSGWNGVLTERIKDAETGEGTSSFQLACYYAKLVDKDNAFASLEKAYQQRSFQMSILNVEPQLDSLRDDPRFADLVRRVQGK